MIFKCVKIFFVVLFCFGAASCVRNQASSGFVLKRGNDILPPGVPRRVGVALFEGEEPINRQATDQFAAGLLKLGFDVIERSSLQTVIDEMEISSSDLFSKETRTELGKQLALEAVFTGSITGSETLGWSDTHLSVKLVDVETGRIIWAATADDPRIFGRRRGVADAKSSAVYSVKHALDLLKGDISKMRKGCR